ncbi:hypothetical protein GQ53DRAFT_841622 [Thozetella sp. PMI_491]|nr:hypothetical protein GQ53DRAFT_841622 [Thozetella sp. PMI_491]
MRGLRESQRAPRRCTECARRRIRCSKTIPCENCVKGGVAHKCAREVVLIRGTPVLGRDTRRVDQIDAELQRENATLRERVARLEAILQRRARRPGRSQISPSSLDQADFEVFSTILEQWNLGAPEQHSSPKEPISAAVPEDLSSTLGLLPPWPDGRLLVQFSLQTLGWIHCALDATSFIRESEAFEASLESGQWEVLQNHAWLAVYLSVLAVGLIFAEGTALFSQLSPQFLARSDLAELPQSWYRAVLRQLELCDFIGRPGLHTVQAIAVLNLCSRHLGERKREVTLTGVAINIARSLKMHLLGSEDSCPARVEQIPLWSTLPARELGRRLWWSLVICDWLGASNHPSSIGPESFDCELSIGEYDPAHLVGPSATGPPSTSAQPLLHHMAMAKLAAVIRTHYEKKDQSPDSLVEILARLDELEEEAPFPAGNRLGEPAWAVGQRCHYHFSINHIRLKICRILFRPDVESPERRQEIRSCALEAAAAICDGPEFPLVYKGTWMFASATIAAGVFLALDLLKSRHSQDDARAERQKQRITSCISAIAPYINKTTICQGGSRILKRLLELIQAYENGMEQVNIMQFIIDMEFSGVLYTQNHESTQQSWQELPTTAIQNSSNLFYDSTILGSLNQFDDWAFFGGDFVF